MKEKKREHRNEEKAVVSLIDQYFDAVLVHSDPKIISLEDSFWSGASISDRVYYTGFISKDAGSFEQPPSPENTIIVTTGGSDKGLKLIRSTIACIGNFPDYTFKFIMGPMMSEQTKTQLEEIGKNIPNMEVVPFVKDFEKLLSHSTLLITLAGFTLISAYAAKIPTISFPAPNSRNQRLVAKKFKMVGSIVFITEKDLVPAIFQNIIQKQLDHPPQPQIEIDICGVKKSVDIIKQLIAKKKDSSQSGA